MFEVMLGILAGILIGIFAVILGYTLSKIF